MLPSIHRLKQEKDFALLARSRKSAYTKLVGMKVRENALPHSRFGIVAGLKVSKRANQRNLLKRRLREIVRKHLKEISPGFDVMIMALTAARGAEYARLEEDTLQAFRKLGLIKRI